MAGYYGYSMSNNAMDAYDAGLKPLSKWRKSDILKAVKEWADENDYNFTLEKLEKVKVSVLKDELLFSSEWHHTSSHFNQTDFYELNECKLEELTDSVIDEWLAFKTEKKTVEEKRARCKYLVWSGSRNHPKATEYVDEGKIVGNWFFPDGESFKKNIFANGFEILEVL